MAKRVEMVPIEGFTYPIREQLKELGGKWNAREKLWYVPETATLQVFNLLHASAAATPVKASKTDTRAAGRGKWQREFDNYADAHGEGAAIRKFGHGPGY